MKCVFWNIHRSERTELVCQLAKESDAGILILAEAGEVNPNLLSELRAKVADDFEEPKSDVPRLRVLARRGLLNPDEFFADMSRRLSVWRLTLGEHQLLLGAVHLISKSDYDEDDQNSEIQRLAKELRRVEDRAAHRRTFLVGDFNMNPFEKGMVKAGGLHATSTRKIAEEGSRTVQGSAYPYFYNPMWSFFGDRPSMPAGTHFYRRSGHHVSYDWHMLDQVLIRPDALPWFTGEVEIVTRIGDTNLCDNFGRPDPLVASDHFPIRFGFAIPSKD